MDARTQELINDLESELEDVRKAAVIWLAQLKDPALVPHLEKLTQDPSPAVQYFARRAVNELKSVVPAPPPVPAPAAGPTIEQLSARLSSPDVEERLRAAVACYNRDDPNLLTAMLATLEAETDPRVVATLVKAVGAFRDPRVMPKLLNLLHHSDSRVRSNTVDAAMALDDAEILSAVSLLASDAASRVRSSVALFLAYRAPDRVESIVREMVDSDLVWMKDGAIYVMHVLGAPWCVPLLERLSGRDGGNPNIAQKATLALRQLRQRIAISSAPLPPPVPAAPPGGASAPVRPQAPAVTPAGVAPAAPAALAASARPAAPAASATLSATSAPAASPASPTSPAVPSSLSMSSSSASTVSPATVAPVTPSRVPAVAALSGAAGPAVATVQPTGPVAASPSTSGVAGTPISPRVARERALRDLGLGNVEARLAALDHLRQVGDAEVEERIEMALRDSDQNVRQRAAETLTEFLRQNAQRPHLRKLGKAALSFAASGDLKGAEFLPIIASVEALGKELDRGTSEAETLSLRDTRIVELGSVVLAAGQASRFDGTPVATECAKAADAIATALGAVVPIEAPASITRAAPAPGQTGFINAALLEGIVPLAGPTPAPPSGTSAAPRPTGKTPSLSLSGRIAIPPPPPPPALPIRMVSWLKQFWLLVTPVALLCGVVLYIAVVGAPSSPAMSTGGSSRKSGPARSADAYRALNLDEVLQASNPKSFAGRAVRWSGSLKDITDLQKHLVITSGGHEFWVDFEHPVLDDISPGQMVRVDGIITSADSSHVGLKGLRLQAMNSHFDDRIAALRRRAGE